NISPFGDISDELDDIFSEKPAPAADPFSESPASSQNPFGDVDASAWGTPPPEPPPPAPTAPPTAPGFMDADDIDFGTENLASSPPAASASGTQQDSRPNYRDPNRYDPDFDFEMVRFDAGEDFGFDDFALDDDALGSSPFATSLFGQQATSEYFQYIPDEFKDAQPKQTVLIASVVILVVLNVVGIAGILMA
ncbi:MAG: hypothetical protein ACLFTK_13150, partial [Anaerolineales bacterium]